MSGAPAGGETTMGVGKSGGPPAVYWRIRLRRIRGGFFGGFAARVRPSGGTWVQDPMPKTNRISQKLELHGEGVSGFSEADIDRRARELALIDNRAEPNAGDRARALAEFGDRNLPDAINEDADSMRSLSRDPSDPLSDRGHQVPEYGTEDEKADLEKMTLEGVEEAQHEQMVQSRNLVDEPLRARPKRGS